MRRDAITSDFDVTLGGDGTVCLIDYSDVNIVYASSQNGSFAKSTSGGDDGTFNSLNVPGTGAWISPMIMDQTDHERLFAGKDNVYRSDDGGDTWVNLQAPSSMELANCLAQGTSNPQRLYVSSVDVIYRVNDALTSNPTWTSIGAGLPALFISGITVDPNNANHVFVSLSGYSDGVKVFRSYNSGDDWTNISSSLPNVPINCIRFHDNGIQNDALYIGTDIGVFTGTMKSVTGSTSAMVCLRSMSVTSTSIRWRAPSLRVPTAEDYGAPVCIPPVCPISHLRSPVPTAAGGIIHAPIPLPATHLSEKI